MLEIGSIVDGKYKILNEIGHGGMSVVYLAMNERANKQWAIKEVRKDGVSNYEVVKQGLIVETNLLKKLNHPNLPSIIDVIDGEDTFLIVMDYIEGNPLNKILKHNGAQSQEDVIEWAKQLCDVLGYLHSRKPPIVYRDMKPSNVMLKPDGNVTLIDFGTAREYKTASLADTTCLGTQGYAAPEQFGGQGQTDGRTDIYCLGATMYHLVTGHNPAEPPYEMYPIRQWNPHLSSGLEAIIIKCTQKNPDDRYQSCAELMYALEHYKDLENETKREYSKKWKLFLGASVASVVCGLGALGFHLASKSQTQSTYEYYVEKGVQAINGGDKATAIDNFSNAIELSPERQEAYMELLNAVLKDNVLEAGENNTLVNALTGTGKTENIDELKEASPSEYAELAYELGDAYYYFYDEPQSGRTKAGKWYAIAAESKTLDSSKVTVASTLSKIINYSDNLGVQRENGEALTSYEDYWNDLMTLIDIDYDQINKTIVGVKVYSTFCSTVKEYKNQFNAEGITDEMILNKFNDVYAKLENIQAKLDSNEINLPLSSRDTLSKAMESVESNISELNKAVNQTNKE